MTTSQVDESVARTGVWSELPIPAEATTSRVVVNNKLLRVVQFAMDTGQELTDHASPRAVTVQMMQGDLSFTVGTDQYLLTAGDVVYLAPGERHALVAQTPCRFTLVLVDQDRD
ncbi:MAG: cupin domain-containing protein [Candidatus Nanopelagicales bacterium]